MISGGLTVRFVLRALGAVPMPSLSVYDSLRPISLYCNLDHGFAFPPSLPRPSEVSDGIGLSVQVQTLVLPDSGYGIGLCLEPKPALGVQ
jgi:hypothetical protein